MPHQPLRLGIVGAGTIAERHVAAAATLPEVAVVAIADVNPAAAGRLAAGCGASVHTGHDAMFRAGGLDAVVIAAPHALHAPITRD
ncbi:MAG: Gfo/Idh/MocA family oxidoreductase, partial [Micromonosporaceae bacterium]|nr:Gfo/Idh/MocA family oxidoreductase [Micromonosporaceae bacterium]